jgi:hypothetical protein
MEQTLHGAHQVRVHIDQKPYESPNPTTGAALYQLGAIGVDLALYKEVEGNREDIALPRDEASIHVHQDQHFHSGPIVMPSFKIIVNAEQKVVQKAILNYAEVVALAYPNPPTGPNVVITVLFKHAAGPVHEGTLSPGGTVTVKNGTVFNVRVSDKS